MGFEFSLGVFPVIMFFIGYYGLITSKKVITSVIFISLMEMSGIMFFLLLGYRVGMIPPIAPVGDAGFLTYNMEYIADPFPQALMITAIIIGIAVTAINLSMLITLCKQSKTSNWSELKKLYSEGDF
ncbi:MAG: cation:proton antiporter subunit C [Defluviitaleaceae bacterium]|nr:cation:proton antiporter subunit C [Defluviitaleaceae bacterium]